MIEGGIPHETVQVDTKARAHKSQGYLRDVHPLGTIPALRLPGGTVMLESGAMVLHLAELAPALAPAAGTTERALFLQWVTYGAATLYPTYLRIYHTDDIVTMEGAREEARATAVEALGRRWAVVEDALGDDGPYLFGQAVSAADVYLAMLALWHPEPERFAAVCPKIAGMKSAVLALPSMRQALALHGLDAV